MINSNMYYEFFFLSILNLQENVFFIYSHYKIEQDNEINY